MVAMLTILPFRDFFIGAESGRASRLSDMFARRPASAEALPRGRSQVRIEPAARAGTPSQPRAWTGMRAMPMAVVTVPSGNPARAAA